MKHPDENPLLNEILEDENISNLRRTSLDNSLAAIRRGHQHRRAMRGGVMAILPLGLIAAFLWLKPVPTSVGPRIAKDTLGTRLAVAPPKTTSVKIISDEELFALFPNRSLALIGKPGHQELVFLDGPARNQHQ